MAKYGGGEGSFRFDRHILIGSCPYPAPAVHCLATNNFSNHKQTTASLEKEEKILIDATKERPNYKSIDPELLINCYDNISMWTPIDLVVSRHLNDSHPTGCRIHANVTLIAKYNFKYKSKYNRLLPLPAPAASGHSGGEGEAGHHERAQLYHRGENHHRHHYRPHHHHDHHHHPMNG